MCIIYMRGNNTYRGGIRYRGGCGCDEIKGGGLGVDGINYHGNHLKTGGSRAYTLNRALIGGCGGTCGLTGAGAATTQPFMFGGSAAPVPAPFIGKPWGAEPTDWPGVNDSRNYYPMNTYKGGDGRKTRHHRRRRHRTRTKARARSRRTGRRSRRRGGGPLLNLGQSALFGTNSIINSMRGVDPPVNPLPYRDQYQQKYQ